jgi:hypothetical protein
LRLDGKSERYALLPIIAAVYIQRKLIELHERRSEKCSAETRPPRRVVSHLVVRKALPAVA